MRIRGLEPLYEPFCRPFVGGIWKRLAKEVDTRSSRNSNILDIGCGPGTVLRFLHKLRPDLLLTGTDIDSRILSIARRKAKYTSIEFKESSADNLSFDNDTFDQVISCFMFHHLTHEQKKGAIKESQRVLKPGGSFLLCDFAPPNNPLLTWWKIIEPEIIPQLEGELLELGKEAGAEIETSWTMFGRISLHVLTFPSNT